MKKNAGIVIGLLVAVCCVYVFGSGFLKNPNVYIEKYTLQADGTEMTIHTGVAASAGYIRRAAVAQQEGRKLFLDFYSAFGGVNGSIGAKNVYTIPIKEDTDFIGIYRNSNCYEQVLAKNADGTWQRVEH
nr:hypothetical protein [uncultured Anaerotignum sp.]